MGTWNRDESGQMIIIAALLLAVIFVGLALVLNSAIYTENMATRGDTSTAEAMSTGSVTEDRLQQSILQANYYSDTASYDDRYSLVKEDVRNWDDLAGSRGARNGRMYYVSESGVTNGTRVVQNESEEFMPGDPDLVDEITGITLNPLGIEDRTTWIPAPNASTRDFEVTVNRSSLVESDQSLLEQLHDSTDIILTGNSEFWIQTQRVDNNDKMWRVYLVNDTANDSVAVWVTKIEGGGENGEEYLQTVCRAEGDSVTVNLTEGRLMGESRPVECPELAYVTGEERNNVYFVGADEVAGSYQFMVDVKKDTFTNRVNHANSDDGLLGSLLGLTDCLLGDCGLDPVVYETPMSESKPYATTALYDVTVETTYQDDRITYTRNVTFPPAAR